MLDNFRALRQFADHLAATSIEQRDNEIRALWLDGLLDIEIAKKLGVSPATVFATRERLGLPRQARALERPGSRRVPKTPPLDAALARYWALSKELDEHHHFIDRRRALEAERRWAAMQVFRLCGENFTDAGRLLKKDRCGVRTYVDMAQLYPYDPAGHEARTAALLAATGEREWSSDQR